MSQPFKNREGGAVEQLSSLKQEGFVPFTLDPPEWGLSQDRDFWSGSAL